ncbi:MAG: hypothetical protein Q8908_04040 [Bacteroidota bacterium]|nr:hypothetical protein [Bacteroidota bacterium]
MYRLGFIFARKSLFVGCVLLIINGLCFAQHTDFERKFSKNWSINLNYGPTTYWGYFCDGKSISTAFQKGISAGYGIVLTKQISPIIGIRAQVLVGSIQGHKDFYDDGSPADLNFSSDIAEGNLSAKIGISDLIAGYKPNRLFNVYGLAGIGLSNFNGRIINSVSKDTLYTIGNGTGKGINGWELDGIVTAGFGAGLRLSKHLEMNVETSMKFLKTAKLGRVKGLLSYDMYSYSCFGLTYKFGLPKENKQSKVPTSVPKTAGDQNETAKAIIPDKTVKIQNEVKTDTTGKWPVKSENKPAIVKKEVVTTPVQEKNNVPVEETKPVEKTNQPAKDDHYTGYKIQIIATLKPISTEVVKQNYKINDQIREDHSGKWNCFSVGEFKTFKEAWIYCKQFVSKYNVKDAFVVKFKDGVRLGQSFK